jgi:hypothetical protein
LLLDFEPAKSPDPNTGDFAIARLVGRLSGAYVLRVCRLMIDVFGDVRVGLLAQAIHTANTAHLDPRTEAGRRIAGPDGILPDDLRRPVSVSRLAESAGLPFESTRRIVQGLVSAGHCVRVEDGVITPGSTLRRPEQAHMTMANLGYTRKFVQDLQGFGLVDASASAWTRLSEETSEVVLARSVARVTSAYILRALELLARRDGDIRAGIVEQTIFTANTAHLDTRPSEGLRYAAIDDPPPDEVRRPVSIARLADSLGLPYETVRGQAHRLVRAGLCLRVEGGLIVPRAVLDRPGAVSVNLANVAHVRKLVWDLQRFRASVSPDEMRSGAPAQRR